MTELRRKMTTDLIVRGRAPRTRQACFSVVQGLATHYHITLGRERTDFVIPMARRPSKLPEVLARAEVARIIEAWWSPCPGPPPGHPAKALASRNSSKCLRIASTAWSTVSTQVGIFRSSGWARWGWVLSM